MYDISFLGRAGIVLTVYAIDERFHLLKRAGAIKIAVVVVEGRVIRAAGVLHRIVAETGQCDVATIVVTTMHADGVTPCWSVAQCIATAARFSEHLLRNYCIGAAACDHRIPTPGRLDHLEGIMSGTVARCCCHRCHTSVPLAWSPTLTTREVRWQHVLAGDRVLLNCERRRKYRIIECRTFSN